jgi:hypothetical protein
MKNFYSTRGGSAVPTTFGTTPGVPVVPYGPDFPPTPCVPYQYVLYMPPLNIENITEDQVDALPDDIQEIIRCPITLQLMSDPVIDIRGRTYEREALKHFLRTRSEAGGTEVDPMDQQLIPNLFIPNLAVRNLIKYYFPMVGGRRKQTKKRKSRKLRKSKKSRR